MISKKELKKITTQISQENLVLRNHFYLLVKNYNEFPPRLGTQYQTGPDWPGSRLAKIRLEPDCPGKKIVCI